MNIDFGAKLRKTRKDSGMSIAALAEKAGVSPGMISQIERGTTVPSVYLFWKIATALGKNVSYFLEEEKPVDRVKLVRAGEHRVVTGTGNEYYLLTPNTDRKIEMYRVLIKKRQDLHGSLTVHDGAECGFILSGSLKIVTDEQVYQMNPGDSIYFESSIPHRLVNDGVEDCLAIWAQTAFTW